MPNPCASEIGSKFAGQIRKLLKQEPVTATISVKTFEFLWQLEDGGKLSLTLYRQAGIYSEEGYEVAFFVSPELAAAVSQFDHLPPKLAIRKGFEASLATPSHA